MSYFNYTPYDENSNVAATLLNINTSFTALQTAIVGSLKAITPDIVVDGGICTAGSFPTINVSASHAVIIGNYHTIGSTSVSALAGADTISYVYITSGGSIAIGSSIAGGGLGLAAITNNGAGTAIASIVDIRDRVLLASCRLVTGTSSALSSIDTTVITKCSSSSAVLLTLPDNPNFGRQVVVKDGKGDASLHNVTVQCGLGASTIDGDSTYLIDDDYQANSFIFNGVEWNVL